MTVGERDFVLLAGLPGAGKSTLLAGLRDTAAMTVRDSDQVRGRLRDGLPAGTPYRAYRPLVHLVHHLRVLVAVLAAAGPVLVHEPATRAVTRHALAAAAWLAGRPAVFIWLDAGPQQALDGQRCRGRMIRPASFARHVARAEVLRKDLLLGAVPPGWNRTVVLDRETVSNGIEVVVRKPGCASTTPV
ncbi:MAG: AAA family ATPase [Pseudonocardiaceae bacterium]